MPETLDTITSSTTSDNLKALIYMFLAILGFIIVYKLYKWIYTLQMSPSVKTAIFVCFWLAAIMVIWMGTIYTMQGKYRRE